MDMKKLLQIVESKDSMKGAEKASTGPKFTGYWKGTDPRTPGDKMVGGGAEEYDESILKDLAKGPTPKTKEQELSEEFAKFMEDNLGVEEKRPAREGSRHPRGHEPHPRYKTVKTDSDHETATGGKVTKTPTGIVHKGKKYGGEEQDFDYFEKARDKLGNRKHHPVDIGSAFDILDLDEAGSPAQQAAIAIAMKKAGKKPKNEQEELNQPRRPEVIDDLPKTPRDSNKGTVVKDYNRLPKDPNAPQKYPTVTDESLSDKDIELQDYRTMSHKEFQRAYGMTKTEWINKNKALVIQNPSIKKALGLEEGREEVDKWAKAMYDEIEERHGWAVAEQFEDIYWAKDIEQIENSRCNANALRAILRTLKSIGNQDDYAEDWQRLSGLIEEYLGEGSQMDEGAEQDPIVARVVKQMRPGLTNLELSNEAFLYFAYELGKQRARDAWSDYLPAIRAAYEHGLNESADLKKQADKYTELASKANKLGDDEKCRAFQKKVADIKKKMSKLEEGYDSREAYDKWDPKHPDFVSNWKEYKAKNPDGKLEDFINKLKGKTVKEGWESGPEEYEEPYDDADDAYDRQRQEKIDTEAEREWAKLPKVSTYKLVGRGPNMEPNYEFGPEFNTQEQALKYREKIMKDPKTPHPEHIGIRTLTRVKEPTDESRGHTILANKLKDIERAKKFATGELKVPTPQERQAQLKQLEKQPKTSEDLQPMANPQASAGSVTQPTSQTNQANDQQNQDPKTMALKAQALSGIKSATGTSATPQDIQKGLTDLAQGKPNPQLDKKLADVIKPLAMAADTGDTQLTQGIKSLAARSKQVGQQLAQQDKQQPKT